MEKDKRLMEDSWWERLTEGETGSSSDGRGHGPKSLIPFSVDGRGCVPSLLFDLKPNYSLVVKIMVTSFKRSHACTAILCPGPCSGHRQPRPPQETPGNSQVSLGQSLVGSGLLSPESCAHKVLSVPSRSLFWRLYGGVNGDLLQQGSCHTQACRTQSPRPCSRPLLTGTSTGDTQRRVWLSFRGVFWCTQVWSEPSKRLWWGRGLILNVISPLLLSRCGFPFAPGHGVSFFGVTQHSAVDGCSAVSCNFGFLTGEDERMSFSSTLL